MAGPARRKTWRSRSLSTQIAIALAAGAIVGLLFGERTAVLDVVADGYIKLLQMTVLPFVTVSIISGLGALDPAMAGTILKRVGLIILLLWLITLGLVFLFPLMFPPHESASFFSTALVQEREAAATLLDRGLRIRYDRLRRARATPVVVALNGDACGACFTAIPRNRRSQIRAGAIIEGCEACGVILYAAES